MTSNDVYVVIGGQSYRIDGETLRPIESDFQREVLKRLDGIDARLGGVEQRLDGVESRLGVLEQEVTIIKHDQSFLQHTVYWGFALMGIVIAVYTLWLSTPKSRKLEDTTPAPTTPSPIIVQIPPYPYVRENEKQS